MPESSLPPPPPRPVPPTGAESHRLVYDHSVTWGLGDAWASLGIFFLTSILVGLALYNVTTGPGLDGAWLPLAVAIPLLLQGLYIWYIAGRKGRGLRRDFALSAKPSDLGLGAVLMIAGMLGAGIVGAFMIWLFDSAPSASVADLAEESADGGGLTIWLVLLAVLASTLVPLVEELVFRGLWWSALEKRGMKSHWILLTTSLVFAAIHVEPQRSAVIFVLGMAVGAGRLATGRLGPAIAAHAMINGTSMLFLLIELS
ncbi:MAG: CPBP family intramembrane metalloprotease [Acidimicrobiaceae bacterium]|nr:CPBP family intramembrane metalloprotease [Acidimicrobiaceae bacterium]